MREEEGCFMIIVAFLVGIALGGAVASSWSTDTEQQKAISNKVGKWVVNPTTGERTFIFECEFCKQETTK